MWAKAIAGSSTAIAAIANAITKVPRRCLALLAFITPPPAASNQMSLDCETRPPGESCAELQPERLGDDSALDLRGAAVDGGNKRLADEALHVVLGGVAVAAHHLHSLQGDPLGGLGDEQLHHRGLLRQHAVLVLVDHARDPVGHELGGLEVGGEVGEAVLERLEGADRAAELLALLAVGQ